MRFVNRCSGHPPEGGRERIPQGNVAVGLLMSYGTCHTEVWPTLRNMWQSARAWVQG
jgi:hypothetical protein